MRRAAPTIILLSFSSFPLIKSSLLPLTDIPYFAMSLLCVASLEILRRKGGGAKVAVTGAALAFMVAAIFVRRVGVALIPPTLFELIPTADQRQPLQSYLLANQMRLVLFVSGAALAAFVGAIILWRVIYLPDFHF